jgi:hypothetical protein
VIVYGLFSDIPTFSEQPNGKRKSMVHFEHFVSFFFFGVKVLI